MGISSIFAAILVLTLAIGSSGRPVTTTPPRQHRACPGTPVIGSSVTAIASLESANTGAQNSRFSITQLPNYPTTQFLKVTNSPTYQLTNFLIQRSGARAQGSNELEQAESLLQSQQYASAETQLQALTTTQAQNPQVWFDLGFAESHLGKSSEAITAYKKAVELSPKWFEANMNLGLALARAGNRADAAAALRAATALKPAANQGQQLSNAWFSLAQVLEETSPAEALAAYQKSLESNPSNTEAALGVGKLMESQGDTAGAEKLYLGTAESGSSSGMERLVSLYLKQKRLPDAEGWLRKYLAANPQNAAAQVQLGRILAAEGKTQEAIAALQAVSNSSTDPAAGRELASLYLEGKQYDAAAKILHDLVQKSPKDAELHCNLGSALLHQHKYAEAEAELIQGLNLNPRLDDAYWELAFAAQQNKHFELAIRVLDARAQRLPETASTYWIRAVAYDSLGAFKPAAQNYKLFLAADAGKLPDDEFKARHRLKAIEH